MDKKMAQALKTREAMLKNQKNKMDAIRKKREAELEAKKQAQLRAQAA